MSDRDPDCLFCKIVGDEVPAERLYEDDAVIAFRDINPRAPTHVLVVPRRHVPDVQHLPDGDGELLARLFGAIRALATEAGLDTGYRVVTNVGPDAGQSVFHLHLHLLGGRSMEWPPG